MEITCNKYGLMTFVTQSCLDEWGFYMGVTQMNDDLWPILPKSTFLKTYPIPRGHDRKTVIYLNYIFRFGLGLRWVISFSVSCFSLFMICLSLDDRTPVRFFDFFERDQFIEKNWIERKLLLIDRKTKWLIVSMTHSVQKIIVAYLHVSRGKNRICKKL